MVGGKLLSEKEFFEGLFEKNNRELRAKELAFIRASEQYSEQTGLKPPYSSSESFRTRSRQRKRKK